MFVTIKQKFSRWATEEPEPDEDGELPPRKPSRKGKAQQKVKAKKTMTKEDALSKQAKGSGKRLNTGDNEEEPKRKKKKPSEAFPDCTYVAGEYSQVRLKFIRKRQAKGWTFKEASACWNTSKTRANILKNMPPSEKARRRFT